MPVHILHLGFTMVYSVQL